MVTAIAFLEKLMNFKVVGWKIITCSHSIVLKKSATIKIHEQNTLSLVVFGESVLLYFRL